MLFGRRLSRGGARGGSPQEPRSVPVLHAGRIRGLRPRQVRATAGNLASGEGDGDDGHARGGAADDGFRCGGRGEGGGDRGGGEGGAAEVLYGRRGHGGVGGVQSVREEGGGEQVSESDGGEVC